MTEKINIEETNIVWAQSLLKGRRMHCHGRTSRWTPPVTSVMNWPQVKRLLWTSVQVAESMFPDPCVMVSCCDMYCHLSQYSTLLFLCTVNKCIELRKYLFPDQCLLHFFLILVGTTSSQNIRHLFLTPCIIYCLEALYHDSTLPLMTSALRRSTWITTHKYCVEWYGIKLLAFKSNTLSFLIFTLKSIFNSNFSFNVLVVVNLLPMLEHVIFTKYKYWD